MADPLKAILTPPPPVEVRLGRMERVPRAEDALDATPVRRIRALWTTFAAVAGTAVYAPIQLARYKRNPSPHTFHKWSGQWARAILRASGVGVDLRDEAQLAGPAVFACNHQTALDILVVAGWIPYPFGFVAKEELRTTPLVGAVLENSACVFVDRRDPRASVRSIQQAGQEIRGGASVLVFPEGVRTYSGGLAPFQRGAFVLALEAGVPVVPVALHGSYRVLDERRMAMRPGRVGLHLMPPISTDGLIRRDIPNLMTQVREQIEGSLQAYEAGR
jgi:1-acyl-sn-glycerol-3-phosphate acyltransferase